MEYHTAYDDSGGVYASISDPGQVIEDFGNRSQFAMMDYPGVIRLNYSLAEVYHDRGIAYLDLGQLQRAIQDYNEAIWINPQFADAYANRAIAYTLLGDYTEAERDIDSAVALGVDPALLRQSISELKNQRAPHPDFGSQR